MPVMIVFLEGLFGLLGLGGFLVGFFADIWWLMIVGGCMVILDDLLEIGMGILHPLFPVLFAFALAIAFSPWYVGVFWASAGFKAAFGIPTMLRKIFTPGRIVARVNELGGP